MNNMFLIRHFDDGYLYRNLFSEDIIRNINPNIWVFWGDGVISTNDKGQTTKNTAIEQNNGGYVYFKDKYQFHGSKETFEFQREDGNQPQEITNADLIQEGDKGNIEKRNLPGTNIFGKIHTPISNLCIRIILANFFAGTETLNIYNKERQDYINNYISIAKKLKAKFENRGIYTQLLQTTDYLKGITPIEPTNYEKTGIRSDKDPDPISCKGILYTTIINLIFIHALYPVRTQYWRNYTIEKDGEEFLTGQSHTLYEIVTTKRNEQDVVLFNGYTTNFEEITTTACSKSIYNYEPSFDKEFLKDKWEKDFQQFKSTYNYFPSNISLFYNDITKFSEPFKPIEVDRIYKKTEIITGELLSYRLILGFNVDYFAEPELTNSTSITTSYHGEDLCGFVSQYAKAIINVQERITTFTGTSPRIVVGNLAGTGSIVSDGTGTEDITINTIDSFEGLDPSHNQSKINEKFIKELISRYGKNYHWIYKHEVDINEFNVDELILELGL